MKKLLYWKGRGTQDVLEIFLSEMSTEYEIIRFPFEYDNGTPQFFRGSKWDRWLLCNTCSIWCGISLGAAMMYAMAAIDTDICPEEMILINPFVSRSQLAHEHGFQMDDQWELELRNTPLKADGFTMVLSVRDEKIGMHHGVELLDQTEACNKRLILLESDHHLSGNGIQSGLAALLHGKEYTYDQIHQYRYIR